MKNNIVSIFCIQGGESGQEAALMLARVFSEKLRKRTVYIPAGVVFDDTGSVSMTELYFDYVKQRELRIDRGEHMTVLKPFNCFAEFIDITSRVYFDFIYKIAEMFDVSVVGMENISSEILLHFIENSATTAIVVDCTQGGYCSRFENFIRNLKLLWKDDLERQLERFIFIMNKGTEANKQLLIEIAAREAQNESIDWSDKMHFLESDFIPAKSSGKGGFGMIKNISKKAEGLWNAK